MAGYAQQARNVISLACALNAKKMRGMKGIQAARVEHQEIVWRPRYSLFTVP